MIQEQISQQHMYKLSSFHDMNCEQKFTSFLIVSHNDLVMAIYRYISILNHRNPLETKQGF